MAQPIQQKGYLEYREFCDERCPIAMSTAKVIDDNLVADLDKEMGDTWVRTRRMPEYMPHIERNVVPRVEANADPDNKGLRVNIGLSIEMIRNGLVDTDFYYQRLRYAAKGNGGYYRKKGGKLHKTYYKHTKKLKELGFITSNKVKNYRKLSKQFSPVQIWVTLPNYALANKRFYKAYLLAVVETYLLQGHYRNQEEGVHKFDSDSKEWNHKQFDRPKGYSVSRRKFNGDIFTYTGQLSDSLISEFLSPYEHFSISTRTIQSWRSIYRFNTYSVFKYYIPVNGLRISKKYRNRKTFYSKKTHKVYLTHVVRKIHTCVNLYHLKFVTKDYFKSIKANGGFNTIDRVGNLNQTQENFCERSEQKYNIHRRFFREYANGTFQLLSEGFLF